MAVINIHLGDSLEAMKSMKENKYDLAIVDPPFGIGQFSRVSNSGVYKKPYEGNNISYRYASDKNWNNSIPNNEYFININYISKRNIIFGANYYNSFNKYGGALVWYKNPGLVSQQSQCEIASLSWKKQVDFIELKKLNGFVAPIQYIHPCEKPIALYKWLLKNYAKPGDKIIDTHGGSMSIAIACIEMGFDLDCWEIDKEYFDAAVNRIQNHVMQLNAFIPQPDINIFK